MKKIFKHFYLPGSIVSDSAVNKIFILAFVLLFSCVLCTYKL